MIDVKGIMTQVTDKIQTTIVERLNAMASAWESAIHSQHMDARMAGLVLVANALLEVKVHVVQKSDIEASLEIESAGLQIDEIKDHLKFYILGPAKTYAFGG